MTLQQNQEYLNLIKDTLSYLHHEEGANVIENNKKSSDEKKDLNLPKIEPKATPITFPTTNTPPKKLEQKKEIQPKPQNIPDVKIEQKKQNITEIKVETKPQNAPDTKINTIEKPTPKIKSTATSFRQEKPTLSGISLKEMEMDFSNNASHIPIKKLLPSDRKAKQILEKWKYKKQAAEITLICSEEKGKRKKLLENIAKSLDIYFYPTRLILAEYIEKEDGWDFFLSANRLKLIIGCDYSIFSLPHLMKHYKEQPNSSDCFLKNTPLFLLPDISLYINDPLLKASLWKALKQRINKIKNEKHSINNPR
jgi:hypothetical protein